MRVLFVNLIRGMLSLARGTREPPASEYDYTRRVFAHGVRAYTAAETRTLDEQLLDVSTAQSHRIVAENRRVLQCATSLENQKT